MSALEDAPSALDTALDRQRERPAEQGSNGTTVVDSRARARVVDSPLTSELKKLAAANPGKAARVYFEALEATKTTFQGDDGWVASPDYGIRLKAADAVYNRIDGLPTARTELTGADGGPVTLAALLCVDVNDSI